jgi:hypothetical protein
MRLPAPALLALLLALQHPGAEEARRAALAPRVAAWLGARRGGAAQPLRFGDVVDAYLATCLQSPLTDGSVLAPAAADEAAAAEPQQPRERAPSTASSADTGPGVALEDFAATRPPATATTAATAAATPSSAFLGGSTMGMGRRGLAEQCFGGKPVVAGHLRSVSALASARQAQRRGAGAGGVRAPQAPALSALQAGRPPRAPLPSAASRDAAGAAPPVNSGLRRELPAALKQLLSVELYRETLRRHHGLEKAGGAKEAGGGLGVASPAPLPATRPTLSLKPQPRAPKAAQVAMAPKEKRDMFGRVVPVAKGTKRGAGAVVGTPEEVFPIRFKYQEGVTDAVRRVVRVRDLL